MKEIIIALICLAVIPSLVFAFGEVTGPVVIHVPIGGSGVGMWGLGHNETVEVGLRVEGDAAQYISLPSKVTLPPTGVYWVNVTAKIPADYNISQGTNITGVMYAVLEGAPGQVKINLQLRKNVFILIEQPQVSNLEEGLFGDMITGLFVLKPGYMMSVIGLVMIIVVTFIYFTKNRREVNK